MVLRRVHLRTGGGGTTSHAAGLLPEFDEATLAGGWPEYATLRATVPAHGLFARHVAGLTLDEVHFSTAHPDARPAVRTEDVVDLVG